MTTTTGPNFTQHADAGPVLPLSVNSRFYADNTVVITATGEVDACSAGKLESIASCSITDCSRLVFDLTGVGFLGVDGLQILVTTVEQGAASGTEVVIAGDHAPVRRALAALEEPLPLYKTLSRALRAPTDTEQTVLRASA